MAVCTAWLACAMALGCRGGDDATTVGAGGSAGQGGALEPWRWPDCPPGETNNGGTCVPAGEGAGIDPSQCAQGFVSDGEQGCTPVLPTAPCPAGQMAIMGETTCRPVAGCGNGTWGDIPTDATTEHVDQSYTGGGNDGSATSPWTSIQAAIDAAASGAIVAVAAGSYGELIYTNALPVRVWGRCPEMVEVISLDIGGVGSEAHGLALISPADDGVHVLGGDVLLEQIWVHDTFDTGVLVYPGAKVTLRGSLVERAVGTGIQNTAGEVVLDGSVVRGTLAEGGLGGQAMNVRNYTLADSALATIVGSVLEDNREIAVQVMASELTVSASVIKGTLPQSASADFGFAIHLQPVAAHPMRPKLTLSDSVLQGNASAGVSLTAADYSIDRTVIEGTLANTNDQDWGHAIVATTDPATGGRSIGTVSDSMLRDNRNIGVLVIGAELAMDGSVVRDTAPRDLDQQRGYGLLVQHLDGDAARSTLVVRGSVVERNRTIAIQTAGADLEIDTSVVRDTNPQASDGFAGRGVNVQLQYGEPGSALVRDSVIASSAEVGTFASSSSMLVEHTLVRGTATAPDGSAGWGIGFQGSVVGGIVATGRVTGCWIDQNHGAGIGATTAELDVAGTLVTGTLPQGGDLLGDGMMFLSDGIQTRANVTASRIEGNARAGVASFGAVVEIGSTALECNTIDIAAEPFAAFSSAFDDLGANHCGCGAAAEPCRSQSVNLQPPPSLPQ